MGIAFGYARVSSAGQNTARQVAALCAAGVEESNIFVDHKSGKDFNRPQWRKLKRKLKPGDLLVMQTLDRFGRDYESVVSEWAELVSKRSVDIRILDNPLLDTTKETNGLVGKVIFDIVLRLISYIAENERLNIKERQRQGIMLARGRGVKFGRPAATRSDEELAILAKVATRQISARDAARLCRVSVQTIYRWMQAQQTTAPQSTDI